jgi:sugar/nucleoside kinase (ribokinase family)
MTGAGRSGPRPDVVVVGAAARDLSDADPRGWRLGGGVTFGALTTARLGLRTVAIVGVDAPAARAEELDLLRDAGCEVRLVSLEHGPVFENIERTGGRLQLGHRRSDPIPVDAAGPGLDGARGWILAPVAGELADAWAAVPDQAAIVALGWQGLLREIVPGEQVRRSPPIRHALVRRADLVGVSRDDLDPDVEIEALYGPLRPEATLAVTQGDGGGLVATGPEPRSLRLYRYPAIRSSAVIDATGAGDVFLAALAAARIQPRLVGGRIAQRYDLLLASAAASLVLEAPGLHGVPDRLAVARRMAEGLAAVAAAKA